MKLFCKDEQGKLRVVHTGDFEVDLNSQKSLRQWLEVETHIRVKSPILTCYERPPLRVEPEVA